MTEDIVDFLRAWTTKHDRELGSFRQEFLAFRAEMNQRLGHIESFLAPLIQSDVDRSAAYRELRDRVERIEKRLDNDRTS